jgi:hypothetical protein
MSRELQARDVGARLAARGLVSVLGAAGVQKKLQQMPGVHLAEIN